VTTSLPARQKKYSRREEHATKDHGMKEEDITPEFKEKLRGLIRTADN
jgi:hypothetical protein